MVKVLDIDWATSDRPVLATQDGCLRIMDLNLTTSTSALLDYLYEGNFFSVLFSNYCKIHFCSSFNLYLFVYSQKTLFVH